MAVTTETIMVVLRGKRVPVVCTKRTGPDLQLIAGCKVLASVTPQRREQMMGGYLYGPCATSPIGSRFD